MAEPECDRGYTRDDLRHFLFMQQAGAAANVDANEIARHLEEDDCAWCKRENGFLYWTEPGLSPAGLARYEQTVRGIQFEEDVEVAEVDPKLPEPLNHPAQAEAIRNLHVLLETAPGNSEESHVKEILRARAACFDAVGASPADMAEQVLAEFKTAFSKMNKSLKERAVKGFPSGTQRVRPLAESLESEGDLLAFVLQIGSMIATGPHFPIFEENGKLMVDQAAFDEEIACRINATR